MKGLLTLFILLASLAACSEPPMPKISCQSEFDSSYNQYLQEALADPDKWKLQYYESAQEYAKAAANLHVLLARKYHGCE